MTVSRDDIGILIVDTSDTYQRILTSILRKLGFNRVQKANNTLKAQVLLEHDKSINVVFCELMMPEPENGLNFVRQVRTRFNQESLPILMMTNMAEREFVQQAVRAGVSGYLIKPVNPDHLEAHLWRLFDLPLRGPQKMGEFLVEEGVVTPEQRDLALGMQKAYSAEFVDVSRLALLLGYLRLKDLLPVYEAQMDDDEFLDRGGEFGLTFTQVDQLRKIKQRHHLRLGDVMVKLNMVKKEVLEDALDRFRLRCVSQKV